MAALARRFPLVFCLNVGLTLIELIRISYVILKSR
ncbi:hypothetical protein VP409E501_P0065 [Vibrio phage 409E50-1]|nr:hypothetical protein VP521E561_P0065 [Vibrio phage 521E56-1]CAH9012927.1 hypothetical protein VP384E501_P0065 [Vibrio phage 384E50-1]CAH9012955.1 hypothetical protein VP409E501_P0065 [Vibrio phage 409E50-1]CAH9013004.1 hypothetical protein VP402E501_P0065 [Vibrio phage 402E50-1]CAH9013767.1 hypothetical protein VP405E501_P0065 [Vibrio phage 405E50-1]CAH9013821.1 hypothetical protein VP413E501_P0065 [Vibrio phage 413E50-1]